MLTNTDLAIVRAALQSLDEEFSPDEDELFQHYLDDTGVLAGASTEHIRMTRAKFDSAQLFTVLKQAHQDELVTSKLIPASTAKEISYHADRESPVSVIVINS